MVQHYSGLGGGIGKCSDDQIQVHTIHLLLVSENLIKFEIAHELHWSNNKKQQREWQ